MKLLHVLPTIFVVILLAACGGEGELDEQTSTPSTTGDSTPRISVANAAVQESNSGTRDLLFTVSLDTPANGYVNVNYTTADGTATIADNDYSSAQSILTIDPGFISTTVTINIQGDTTPEGDENFTLTLSNPTANVTLGQSVATGTVLNDDLPNDEKNLAAGDDQIDNINTPAIPSTSGFHYVDIASSTDGANLESSIYLPVGFSPDDGPYPVIMFINGGQGLRGIDIPPRLKAESDKRSWIVITSSGRQWDLFEKSGCTYTTAMAYLNHPDPDIGPDETDRLDVIQWVKDNYKVNEDKVYLSGFSLGGRGAYQIGLRNPDIFAGIALFAPAVDLFELDIYTDTSRESYPCRMIIAGGIPGTSLLTRTRRLMSSARFLIENAYNLPIFQGHGYYDGLANNVANAPVRKYLHGYHMTIDNSFNEAYEYDGKIFNFGHTPTLSELNTEHPDGYNFAYMFSDNGHSVDNRWVTGTPIAPEVEGIQHPDNSTIYIGAIDFLASKTRVLNPKTVFYKTYTDEHRRSHWVEIDIESPWQAIPGAVKATPFTDKNTINMHLSHIDTVTIDIDRIGLTIGTSSTEPLTIQVFPMNSNTYDPALKVTSVMPKIVLSGNFSELAPTGVEVMVDNQILDQTQITITDTKLEIDKILVQSVTNILIYLKQ